MSPLQCNTQVTPSPTPATSAQIHTYIRYVYGVKAAGPSTNPSRRLRQCRGTLLARVTDRSLLWTRGPTGSCTCMLLHGTGQGCFLSRIIVFNWYLFSIILCRALEFLTCLCGCVLRIFLSFVCNHAGAMPATIIRTQCRPHYKAKEGDRCSALSRSS